MAGEAVKQVPEHGVMVSVANWGGIKDLNISITPLLIDSVRTSNGIINTQPFEIVIGETMMVTNVKCDCRNVRKFMLKEKRRLESNKDMFI